MDTRASRVSDVHQRKIEYFMIVLFPLSMSYQYHDMMLYKKISTDNAGLFPLKITNPLRLLSYGECVLYDTLTSMHKFVNIGNLLIKYDSFQQYVFTLSCDGTNYYLYYYTDNGIEKMIFTDISNVLEFICLRSL